MNRPVHSPSRIAVAVMSRLVPDDDRDQIVGDLTETYADRVAEGRRFNALWFWGQTLDWGYYSKPPLIAWILRLSTSLSDARFFIRLPLPLIHAATAVLVALVARRLLGPRIGGIAGFAFATLPAVALGSLLVSTDTPMLLCFALAMRDVAAAHPELDVVVLHPGVVRTDLGARTGPLGWLLSLVKRG